MADAAAEAEEALCVVCAVAPRDVLLTACGHLLLCDACAATLLARGDACPLCRTAVRAVGGTRCVEAVAGAVPYQLCAVDAEARRRTRVQQLLLPRLDFGVVPPLHSDFEDDEVPALLSPTRTPRSVSHSSLSDVLDFRPAAETLAFAEGVLLAPARVRLGQTESAVPRGVVCVGLPLPPWSPWPIVNVSEDHILR